MGVRKEIIDLRFHACLLRNKERRILGGVLRIQEVTLIMVRMIATSI